MWLSAFLNPAFCKNPGPWMLFKACWGQWVLDEILNAIWFSHTSATSKKAETIWEEGVIRGVFYCFTTFQKNSWWMKQVRLWESSWFWTDSFIPLQTTCRLLVLVSTRTTTSWDSRLQFMWKAEITQEQAILPSSLALSYVPCWNSRFLLFVFQGVCLIKSKQKLED